MIFRKDLQVQIKCSIQELRERIELGISVLDPALGMKLIKKLNVCNMYACMYVNNSLRVTYFVLQRAQQVEL